MSEARYVTETGFVAEPGVVINDRYELVEPIGRGATAHVWSARHKYGRFTCAVKFMNCDRSAYKLGLDEFRLLSLVYHPNIVRTFDMGEIPGVYQAYITMEYVNGTSLAEYIGGEEPASAQEVVLWLKQMVDVLGYLHSPQCNLIHKDIKPANIVVEHGRAVLIDFNISAAGTHLQGTRAYKCPTVTTEMRWSTYADIWALAVTFYEVLTSRRLFKGETSFDVGLDGACPTGCPPPTFDALRNIIHGAGRDAEPDGYHQLFSLIEVDRALRDLPNEVLERYNLTSLNQRFLALALANVVDRRKPRSKDVIIRTALHAAKRPASAGAMKKLKPVFSQLKSRGVVEYRGKNKAVLTEAFVTALDDAVRSSA